ncbi:hypothetical protein HGRIS_010344 [Hohenbuehelia grisea]|uniref:AB hydrolase-1 domain-containing protein n=1 Tax=Hohenbuehelia grisea TaxID=104357 RepID=A0ABR3J489_9AGAR
MKPPPSPYHCLTLSLLLIPPLLLAATTAYLLQAFPPPRNASSPLTRTDHGLAGLPLNHTARELYPEHFYDGGAYARLLMGKVRYWLIGPVDGRRVVLVNGLSIPAVIWKDVAPALATQGFRVLLYDLYGRGYSDAPHTTYDVGLYTNQLAFLMQHIRWDKADIVGVSMGGAIAAAFTYHFPHLVGEHVGLIASAGIMQSADLPRTAKFMSSPLIQRVAKSKIVRTYLQRLAEAPQSGVDPVSPSDSDSSSDAAAKAPSTESQNAKASKFLLQEIVRVQSAHLDGYNGALASSLREGPIRGLRVCFEGRRGVHGAGGNSKVKEEMEGAADEKNPWTGRNVLLIHGTDDPTVPYKYAGEIAGLLSGAVSPVQLDSPTDGGYDGEDVAPQTLFSSPHPLSSADPKSRLQSHSQTVPPADGTRPHTRVVTVHGGKHDLTVSHPALVVRELVRLFGGAGPRESG